jgi:phosphatidylglycerophosphate synthase
MQVHRANVIIIAEPADALTIVCGISILERLLRTLQRLGVERATILSPEPEPIAIALARPSWARAEITSDVRSLEGPLTAAMIAGSNSSLVLCCACYDSRVLDALLSVPATSLLIDSDPPDALRPLLASAGRIAPGYWCGAALVGHGWIAELEPARAVSDALREAAARGGVKIVDVAKLPPYVASMRRDIRPFWFPPPDRGNMRRAERVLLDAAQNGTLDLPAKLHAPIETWIIARLCRTKITPMHITLFTACVSAAVTILFASGHLALGVALALIVGVLDGLDGKQARVKVETTELGKREHVLDYVLELSWWTALAYDFAVSGDVPNAFALLALLVGADLVDQLARRVVKNRVFRNLDDVAPFDRFVRLIGARRNIYVWVLAAGLLLRQPDKSFVAICWWGALTAAVHVTRAVWIRMRAVASGGAH